MILKLKDYNSNEIFRFIRENTGLTQKDFGIKIGKSRRTIQDYELGKRNYDFKLLLEIAKIYNLEIIIEKKNFKLIANHYEAGMIIKIIREYLNLTQKDFGEKIAKKRRTIQDYERNIIKYNFDIIVSITEVFGFNLIIHEKRS